MHFFNSHSNVFENPTVGTRIEANDQKVMELWIRFSFCLFIFFIFLNLKCLIAFIVCNGDVLTMGVAFFHKFILWISLTHTKYSSHQGIIYHICIHFRLLFKLNYAGSNIIEAPLGGRECGISEPPSGHCFSSVGKVIHMGTLVVLITGGVIAGLQKSCNPAGGAPTG